MVPQSHPEVPKEMEEMYNVGGDYVELGAV
jgi:hypothetical protein